VDTSVLGGTLDAEFAGPSSRFLEQVRKGKHIILVSGITYAELANAPPRVQEVLQALPDDAFEEVAIDDDVMTLAKAYVSAGVVPNSAEYDALHVAAATVAGADLVLSWNFRHIVNYDRIKGFNAVNLLNGYRTLDIHSPLELSYGDEDENI